MYREPLWRKILAWGATVLFLSLPVGILALRIIGDFHRLPFSASVESAKFTVPYFGYLSALLFGLAGIGVVDRKVNGHSSKEQKKDS